jgi:hypothetical protein
VAAEEVHHEILCAVIQAEGTDQQALTAATPHNVPLHSSKCAAAHFVYLGCKQRIRSAVNDHIGIEPAT